MDENTDSVLTPPVLDGRLEEKWVIEKGILYELRD